MNAYINTTFKGRYPVGVVALVIAPSAADAAALLNAELIDRGLPQDEPITAMDMAPINTDLPRALILADGDY